MGMTDARVPPRGRVFLVGTPRSGTTLLQSLLGSHSAISSFPESHFFIRSRSSFRLFRKLGLASRSARTQLARFLEEVEALQGSRLVDSGVEAPRPMLFRRSYLRYFIATLDTLARSRGSSVWIEKTPDHIGYIDEISRLVPGARFIHLIRDPADVVASLYEVTREHPGFWGGPRSIDECFDKWLRNYRRSLSLADHPNHTLVRYEQLVARPESVLQSLCDFLGVDFEAKMLEAHGHAAFGITAAYEPWKAGAARPIEDRSRLKFAAIFGPRQQAHLIERMREAGVSLLPDVQDMDASLEGAGEPDPGGPHESGFHQTR